MQVGLVANKTRITSLGPSSTPRVEMNGATLSMRLLRAVVSALKIPVKRAWVVGDSTVVLASREKSAAAFSEYFANRIGEQKELQHEIEDGLGCPVGEWYHVASKFDAADCPSRLDTTPAMIGPDSEWQLGPSYLYLSRKEWALERDFTMQKTRNDVPREELRSKYRDLPGHLIMAGLHEGNVQERKEGLSNLVVCQLCPVAKSLAEPWPVAKPSAEFCPVPVTKSGRNVKQGRNLESENVVAEGLGWGYNTNNWEVLVRKTAAIFRPFLEFKKRKMLREVEKRKMLRGGGLTDAELADLARYSQVKPVNFWMTVASPATRAALDQGKLNE